MNPQQAVRKMTELRLMELAAQLRVRPGGAALECICWNEFAELCCGHEIDELTYHVLAKAETFLAGAQ